GRAADDGRTRTRRASRPRPARRTPAKFRAGTPRRCTRRTPCGTPGARSLFVEATHRLQHDAGLDAHPGLAGEQVLEGRGGVGIEGVALDDEVAVLGEVHARAPEVARVAVL